jgi:AcrR family transcriptional regulator
MSPHPVKTKRRYDSARRREQALRTRSRVVAAAERRFLRDGYAATTVASIAADAAVSADTIYKSFGGKPGLVRAVRDRALLGAGPVPAETRSDALQLSGASGREIIEGWGRLTTEVAPRAAPIMLLMRDAAASDPEAAALLDEMNDDRLRRMADNARRLRATGDVRAGLGVDKVADILWTYSSQELYEMLVLQRGWSLRRYGRFLTEAMSAALLEEIAASQSGAS